MLIKEKAPLIAASLLIPVSITRIVVEFVSGPGAIVEAGLFFSWTALFCYSLYAVFNIGMQDEYKCHAQKLIKWLAIIAFVFLLSSMPVSLHKAGFLSSYLFDSVHWIITFFYSIVAATCLFILGSSIQNIRTDDIPLLKALNISIYFFALFQVFYAAERLLAISGGMVAMLIFFCLCIDTTKFKLSSKMATVAVRLTTVLLPVLFVIIYFNNLHNFTQSSSDFISDIVWGDDGFTPRKVTAIITGGNDDALVGLPFTVSTTLSNTPIIHSAWFVDENAAFAVSLRKVYTSVDRGGSWQHVVDLPFNAERITASQDGLRVVVELSDRNVVFISEDAGKSWKLFDLTAQLLASGKNTRDEDFIWNRSSQLRLNPQTGYGHVIFDCEHWYTEDFSKTWQSVSYNKTNGKKLCPSKDADAVKKDQLSVITAWGTLWTRDNKEADFSKGCQNMNRDGAVSLKGIDECEEVELEHMSADALMLDLITDNILDADDVTQYTRNNNGITWIESHGFLALKDSAKKWQVLFNTSVGYSQYLMTGNKALSVGNDDVWYTTNNGRVWLPLGLSRKDNHRWNDDKNTLFIISENKLLAITFLADKPEVKRIKTFAEDSGVNDVEIGTSQDNNVMWLINEDVKLLSIDDGITWQSFDNDQIVDVDCIHSESCVAFIPPSRVVGFNAVDISKLIDIVDVPLTEDDIENDKMLEKIWHTETAIMIADNYEEIVYRYTLADKDIKRLRIAIDEYSPFDSLKWSVDNTIAYAEKYQNIIYLVNLQQDSWQELSFDAWDEVHILCASENAQYFVLQGKRGESYSLIISHDFGITWQTSSQRESITNCEMSQHQLWMYTESELSVYGALQ